MEYKQHLLRFYLEYNRLSLKYTVIRNAAFFREKSHRKMERFAFRKRLKKLKFPEKYNPEAIA